MLLKNMAWRMLPQSVTIKGIALAHAPSAMPSWPTFSAN